MDDNMQVSVEQTSIHNTHTVCLTFSGLVLTHWKGNSKYGIGEFLLTVHGSENITEEEVECKSKRMGKNTAPTKPTRHDPALSLRTHCTSL